MTLHAMTASALSAAMQRGEISSREVVDAHLARIAVWNPRLRAYCEVFEVEVRARADTLDEERRQGRVRGPLHGLPVSVKERFDLSGDPLVLAAMTAVEDAARGAEGFPMTPIDPADPAADAGPGQPPAQPPAIA